MNQRVFLRCILFFAFGVFTCLVNAQSWPTKPVKVIVPLPPGSGTDITGRAIAERLSAQTGQTFVVENRPGGSGSIGMNAVAKADPDGYTILIMSSSWTVTPVTVANLPYVCKGQSRKNERCRYWHR
jgi:tripartite-type tricarboxylate transporter receptor subunit TctC